LSTPHFSASPDFVLNSSFSLDSALAAFDFHSFPTRRSSDLLVQQSVMINILGEDLDEVLQKIPVLKHGFVHLYGKSEAKAKRKMGHITFVGSTAEDIQKQLNQFKEANQ